MQRNETTSKIRKARQDYKNKITEKLKQALKKLWLH